MDFILYIYMHVMVCFEVRHPHCVDQVTVRWKYRQTQHIYIYIYELCLTVLPLYCNLVCYMQLRNNTQHGCVFDSVTVLFIVLWKLSFVHMC